ncbi:MAG: ChaB family protein [Burkholderiales bacterium]|nr:ChaB family protein [Burkholderiales bacterium]
MPYKNNSDLPESVKNNLPKHAQDIYRAAFNNTYEEYKEPNSRRDDSTQEEVAHKVAWAAVKNKYIKNDNSGNWIAK